jgi:tetratricopeptide (TPR) repeat protein
MSGPSRSQDPTDGARSDSPSVEPPPGTVPLTIEVPVAPTVVGREGEMNRLGEFLGRISQRNGGFLLLSGEAGVGKTRLVHEAGRMAASRGLRHLSAACQDRDRGVAYAPWVELIRRFVEQNPRELVFRAVGPHMSALTKLVPELADQVWLYDPRPTPVEWERRPFLAAVSKFFVALSDLQPLVLAIDDVGWADAASLELLETVVRVSRGSGLGVVAAYRDTHLEENPPLQQLLFSVERERWSTSIVLSPLDREHLGELIGVVFGRPRVSGEFRDVVFAKTRGNPFYTREILQSLADEGVIFRTAEGWDWKPVSSIRLPSTVGRTIEGRLNRLDEESLRVVRIASLLGLEFPFDLLERVAELDRERLLSALEKAGKAKILLERKSADRRTSYQFAHPLIQEVLEGEVGQARAQMVHLHAARVLEETYGSGAKEHAASIAYHYLRGNDAARALEYSVEAGDRAAAVFARDEAASHYRAALELLRETNNVRLRSQLKGRLADQLRGLSQIDAAAGLYEEAGRGWEATGERTEAGDALRKAAECFQGSMQHETELRVQALRLLEEEPPTRALVLLYLSNALTTYDSGRVAEARTKYEQALDLATTLGDVESQAWALLRLAYCAPTERREEFVAYTDRAAKIVEDHHLTERVAVQVQLNRAAYAYHCVGDVGMLVAAVQGAIKTARAVNDVEFEAWVIGFALPWIYLRTGDLREAWQLLEERRGRFRFVGLAGWAPESESVGVRAWVGTLLGPLARAEELLVAADAIGRQRPNWFIDAVTFQFLGRLRFAQGDLPRAIVHFEEALGTHGRAGFPAWHLQWTCEILCLLTRAYLENHEPALARQRAEQAELFAQKLGSEPARAFALRARALCALGSRSDEDPLKLLEQSRATWERLGWKYDLGVTWFDTGNAYASNGDDEKAANSFREALANFDAVGAQPDKDRTVRRMNVVPS